MKVITEPHRAHEIRYHVSIITYKSFVNFTKYILGRRSVNKEVKVIVIYLCTSVDIEMGCPKGKCGCQYSILLTLKKNNGHRGPGFFLIKN